MARKKTQGPTAGELEILKVLWEAGPSSVREVLEVLARRRRVAYTTVLRMLQIMTEKGLVLCDREQSAHVYQPAKSRQAVENQMAGDLLERLFDGSTSQLVVSALARKQATPAELAKIRRLVEEIERRGK
jgi:BlaI family transcriptional regulator, penicillinase repressor